MARKITLALLISVVICFVVSFSAEEELSPYACQQWLRKNLVKSEKVEPGGFILRSQITIKDVDFLEWLLGLKPISVSEMEEKAPIKSESALDDIEQIGETRIRQMRCLGFELKRK